MNESYWLSADATPLERATFRDLDSTINVRGELINDSSISHLVKIQIESRSYYVKVYHHAGRNLRRFVGRSRVRAEWQNQHAFGEFGIPSARIVAFGESKGPLGAHKGVIVTEEVPDTIDLFELAQQKPEWLHNREWTKCVIGRLASHVRSMHAHRFVHNDLKWRNILVDFRNTPEVYIIDCPLGRRRIGPWLQRGIVKDLACLDLVAKKHLSRTQRLRFYKSYKGVDHLTNFHRRQIERVLRFFEGRE